MSAIALFASQLNDPGGVCFQEASVVTDNQGDNGVDGEEEDVDAELQALAEVVDLCILLLGNRKSWCVKRCIWCCRRLVRTLPRLTLIWEIPTMLIRSVLTAAVTGSCQADMQVYSSVYRWLQTDAWMLYPRLTDNKLPCMVTSLADTVFPLLQTSDSKVGNEAPTEAAEDLPGEDDDPDMTDAEDAPPATEADNNDGDAAGDIEATVTPALQGLVQMLLHQHSSFADFCASILKPLSIHAPAHTVCNILLFA